MPRLAGIFDVGTTGETFIVAEWYPDPVEIQAQLLRFAVATEDMKVPLAAAREAFIYDTQLHFETESDPYGQPWIPLADSYRRRKLAEGDDDNLLKMTGALEGAATKSENWIITENEILFNLEGLPFYGPFHQSGTMDINLENIQRKLRSGILLEREEAGYTETFGGRGRSLPQRMFIGADEDTIAEVEEIFLKWLDGLIREDFPPIVDTPPAFGIGYSKRGPAQIIGFLSTGQPRLAGGIFGRKP